MHFLWAHFPWLMMLYLDGGLEHVLFSHVLGIIIPIDLYLSEGLKPPASDGYIMFLFF